MSNGHFAQGTKDKICIVVKIGESEKIFKLIMIGHIELSLQIIIKAATDIPFFRLILEAIFLIRF